MVSVKFSFNFLQPWTEYNHMWSAISFVDSIRFQSCSQVSKEKKNNLGKPANSAHQEKKTHCMSKLWTKLVLTGTNILHFTHFIFVSLHVSLRLALRVWDIHWMKEKCKYLSFCQLVLITRASFLDRAKNFTFLNIKLLEKNTWNFTTNIKQIK